MRVCQSMNRSACLLSLRNLLTFFPSQNNHLKEIWHILRLFRRFNEEDASSLAFDGERWNSLYDQWPRELHTRFTILTWGSSGGIVKLCLPQSRRQSRNCYHFVVFRNLIALWFSLTCKTLSGLGLRRCKIIVFKRKQTSCFKRVERFAFFCQKLCVKYL